MPTGNDTRTDDPIYGVSLADASIGNTKLGEGAVSTQKVLDRAITTPKLANLSITTDKVADASITTDKIADGAITDTEIANGAITPDKLAPLGQQYSSTINALGLVVAQDITGSAVSITTTGRPVFLVLQPADANSNGIGVFNTSSDNTAAANVQIECDGTPISGHYILTQGAAANIGIIVPPGCISYVHAPSAGAHTYNLRLASLSAGTTSFSIFSSVFVVYPL